MAVLNIGDRVEVLDDTIKGTVQAIDGDSITIMTKDGFPLEFNIKDLVKVSDEIKVSNFEITRIKKEKERPKQKKHKIARPKDRNVPKMEVDLHINQLVKNPKEMSNYEMLNLQLETAKGQLEFAMQKRIQKIVFIHGVGEGVLREELYSMFRRYDNVDFYDADYQKYGMGATEVHIFQNA